MLALVALSYLLLALRVRIGTEIWLSGLKGGLSLCVQAAGVSLCFDGEIIRPKKGDFFRVVPRYGKQPEEKQTKQKSRRTLRMIKAFLWLGRTGCIERLSFDARVGLGDAGETALAAGCLQALAAALFARLNSEAAQEIRVAPDFETTGLCVMLRCIFSCQAGDIMLAVIRTAVKKAGERDWIGKASH